jgi:hypothetical protein
MSTVSFKSVNDQLMPEIGELSRSKVYPDTFGKIQRFGNGQVKYNSLVAETFRDLIKELGDLKRDVKELQCLKRNVELLERNVNDLKERIYTMQKTQAIHDLKLIFQGKAQEKLIEKTDKHEPQLAKHDERIGANTKNIDQHESTLNDLKPCVIIHNQMIKENIKNTDRHEDILTYHTKKLIDEIIPNLVVVHHDIDEKLTPFFHKLFSEIALHTQKAELTLKNTLETQEYLDKNFGAMLKDIQDLKSRVINLGNSGTDGKKLDEMVKSMLHDNINTASVNNTLHKSEPINTSIIIDSNTIVEEPKVENSFNGSKSS